MLDWLRDRRKAIVGAVGLALTVGAAVLGENHPWVAVLVALGTALGIERVPNGRGWTWRRGDRGAIDLVVVLVVLLIIIAVVVLMKLVDVSVE